MRTENLRLLFIGNSHTYFNDMPHLVAELFRDEGMNCEVTMIAHGGWYLEQHVEEPDVRFNILYGDYDYVILQEYSHPFGPEEKYFHAAKILNTWIQEAGSTPVIYLTWAKQDEEYVQPRMNQASEELAQEIGALLAPVGIEWWRYRDANPDIEMYYKDGAHASAQGSAFAAKTIYETIHSDIYRKR